MYFFFCSQVVYNDSTGVEETNNVFVFNIQLQAQVVNVNSNDQRLFESVAFTEQLRAKGVV